jgi:hypothetical protein
MRSARPLFKAIISTDVLRFGPPSQVRQTMRRYVVEPTLALVDLKAWVLPGAIVSVVAVAIVWFEVTGHWPDPYPPTGVPAP